jgi:hypothetical protein
MKYFFDTEFQEMTYPEAPMLISIGITDEKGRQFYATANFEEGKCNQWTLDNLLPVLHLDCWQTSFTTRVAAHAPLDQIRREVLEFVGNDPEPQFWAYYGAYDWFLLCQIFGGMMQLPAHWQETYYDLRVMLNAAGHSNVGQPSDHIHNALLDARWVKATWEQYLRGTPNG